MVDPDLLVEACSNLGVPVVPVDVDWEAGGRRYAMEYAFVDGPIAGKEQTSSRPEVGFGREWRRGPFSILGDALVVGGSLGPRVVQEYAVLAALRHANRMGYHHAAREMQPDGSVVIRAVQRGAGFEVRVSPKGPAEVEAVGLAPGACERATAGLEQDLGGDLDRVRKRTPGEPGASARQRLPLNAT